MPKKSGPIRSLWSRLSPWSKGAATLLPIFAVIAIASPYALAMLSWLPFAQKATESVVVVLVDRSERQINSAQITRQMDIERLKSRCAVQCDQFDRKALENLIRDWQEEQKDLDRLRQKKQ